MNIDLSVEVLGGTVDAVVQEVSDVVREHMRKALLDAAEAAKQIWLHRARQKGVESQSYLEGIREADVEIEAIVQEGDAAIGSVRITNTADNAGVIEYGHGAFHLPSRIHWPTPKTKTAKDGTRYLDVPLRHYAFATPEQQQAHGYTHRARKNMLPEDIYQYAKKLARTIRMNLGPQYDRHGNYKAADRYRVEAPTPFTPARLSRAPTVYRTNEEGLVTGRAPRPKLEVPGLPVRYEGLIRTGPPRHTQYLTIRRLTEKSKGWNIPAKEGKHVARDVATVLPEVLPGVIEASIGEGLE